LKRSQVPGNPEVLVEALRSVFYLGSRELLSSILKALRDEEVRLRGDRAPIRNFADSIEDGLRSIESGVL